MNNHDKALEMYAAIQSKKKEALRLTILRDTEANNYAHYMEKRMRGRKF
jgi:hypothetical protein